MKGARLKSVLVLAMWIVLIVVSVAYLVFDYVVPLQVIIMPYDFVLTDKMGFNLDGDRLHFGSVCPICDVKRSVYVTNNHEIPVALQLHIFSSDGSDTSLNVTSKNVITSGSNATITIILVPTDLPTGTYEGTIQLQFRKALPWQN